MKKKILIGALALASVFTLASATDGNSSSSETERRFWGSQIVGVQSCVQSGSNPDGSPTYTVTYIVEYYVLWIGVQTSTESRSGMSHCEAPSSCGC
ncbi:hypothetical protein [Chryseobacterium mucoviscidosis]|uniref:hypothetical protein n=1 Tax=Chryseobacterium mucoviscidosis TaxID=1945581 RepID=UPI00301883A3